MYNFTFFIFYVVTSRRSRPFFDECHDRCGIASAVVFVHPSVRADDEDRRESLDLEFIDDLGVGIRVHDVHGHVFQGRLRLLHHRGHLVAVPTPRSGCEQHAWQFEFGRERDETIERHTDGDMDIWYTPGKKNDMRTRLVVCQCVCVSIP